MSLEHACLGSWDSIARYHLMKARPTPSSGSVGTAGAAGVRLDDKARVGSERWAVFGLWMTPCDMGGSAPTPQAVVCLIGGAVWRLWHAMTDSA